MEESWKGFVTMKVGMLECNGCGTEAEPEQVQQKPVCELCKQMDWNIVVNKIEESRGYAV